MGEHKNKLTKRQLAFLRRLAEARDRLRASIQDLDENELCNEPVTGDWTVKDILGHIVTWNDEFRANIASILKGEHPGYDHIISEGNDFSAWNQQAIEKKRSWSFDRIRQDLERDFQEAVNLIEGL
jgi:uncharacterized damage-inducible protein DinB